ITVDTVTEHLRPPNRGQEQTPIGDLKKARDDFERTYIIQALKQHDKNITRAAKFLGMDRTNLHRKLKSLEIDPDTL
ncbi:MAG TPA: helix-turn-helix domain-containing protein, partial [Leptospiraceae bacterium]|nr:helix-turn-helix domain-containing protein [Leptospiraceae bacterium]